MDRPSDRVRRRWFYDAVAANGARLMHVGSAALAAVLVVACDIPTELPKWDTTFVVQAESTVVAVGEILPSSVTVAPGGNAFLLSLSPATFSKSLGEMCPACLPFNGLAVPKPAFADSIKTTIALPADVSSGALISGTIAVQVQNGFNFDPLRPNGGASPFGSLTIAIRSGATLLGSVTRDGSVQALPAGGAVSFDIPLNGAATVGGALDVTAAIVSPAGGTTTINTNSALTVTATPTNMLLSSVQVRVQDRIVNATQVALNTGGIDSFVTDHIQGGSLLLTFYNPFNVTGTLTLTITGGTQTVTKQVPVAAGATTVEVPFTAEELKSFIGLGHDVTLSMQGPVTSASPVTATPSQVLSVSSQLKLIIGAKD